MEDNRVQISRRSLEDLFLLYSALSDGLEIVDKGDPEPSPSDLAADIPKVRPIAFTLCDDRSLSQEGQMRIDRINSLIQSWAERNEQDWVRNPTDTRVRKEPLYAWSMGTAVFELT